MRDCRGVLSQVWDPCSIWNTLRVSLTFKFRKTWMFDSCSGRDDQKLCCAAKLSTSRRGEGRVVTARNALDHCGTRTLEQMCTETFVETKFRRRPGLDDNSAVVQVRAQREAVIQQQRAGSTLPTHLNFVLSFWVRVGRCAVSDFLRPSLSELFRCDLGYAVACLGAAVTKTSEKRTDTHTTFLFVPGICLPLLIC